jgi:hypothetical protein
MFNFDKSDFQRTVAAALGALILSTTMVVSAVGPARAVETSQTPVQAAQVSGQAVA